VECALMRRICKWKAGGGSRSGSAAGWELGGGGL
jgi:hypothetical protein